MAEVTISVGPDAKFLPLLRTVAASVAARLDFSYDSIDELRLAVHEAGACLLSEGGIESRLKMKVKAEEEGLDITLSISGTAGRWPPPGLENTLAWKILAGLTDSVDFFVEDRLSAIQLRVARPPGETK
ncbi:MAG: hypothetical protein ACR2FO_03575 [Actinomycetota bacterium]